MIVSSLELSCCNLLFYGQLLGLRPTATLPTTQPPLNMAFYCKQAMPDRQNKKYGNNASRDRGSSSMKSSASVCTRFRISVTVCGGDKYGGEQGQSMQMRRSKKEIDEQKSMHMG